MIRPILCAGILLFASSAQAQTYEGRLDPADPARDQGSWYDAYTFDAAVAQLVRVRMTSADFDTYLIVRSPTGVETVNDDFDGQSVSLVELLASEAGTWTIWASAYGPSMGGAYAVDVELGGVGKLETLSGRLDPSDATALKGEYYDTHSVAVRSEEPFVVELVSLGFDGYLVVTSPSGEVWRNDDTGSQTLSRIGPVKGAGTWRVDVTSAGPEQVGAYDVRIITLPAN